VWRGLLLLCLAGVVWGTIGPGVHLVHERSDLSVLEISAYRAVAALVTLALAARVTRRLGDVMVLGVRHTPRVIAVGLLTAAFQLLFFVSVVAVGVSVATMVALGFPPVLLLVLACVRAGRLPSAAEVATVLAALLGLALVSLTGGGSHGSHALLGVVAALGSGTAYALSAQAASPLTRRHDALAVTTATMTVASAVLIPAGLLAGFADGGGLPEADAGTWWLVAYLGAVTMAAAYVLLFAGLRSTPPGTAVVATLLEPVTAVMIAVLFLGEQLTATGVIGSVLIVGAIASLGRRMQEPQAQ
jgi:DME family drug/metabolite transporter